MNNPIDIVIPWVDGADQEWASEKNNWYKKLNPDTNSNSNNRYQSWDNLKYWFRAVEKYLPWINNVFFVTWGHIPQFLDVNHPKIRIVKHSDFIPKKYLPTFNVNTIELNLCNISDLSENFIYFNDDTFPLAEIDEEYYFKENMVCDEAIETPIIPIINGEISKFTWNMCALNIAVINKHFKKREVQNLNYEKWFCKEYEELLDRNNSLSMWDNFVGFRNPHMPNAFKKSTFKKIWDVETDVLNSTCKSKFRNYSCVNQWLVRYWQICEGDFIPRKTQGKSYTVTIDNYKDISEKIKNSTVQMICLNEECTEDEFKIIKQHINLIFNELFPDKSSYEK